MKGLTLFTLFSLAICQSSFSYEEGYMGVHTLSVEEDQQAREYYHQGIADKRQAEACAGEDGKSDLCVNGRNAFKKKGAQTLEAMFPIVKGLYQSLFHFVPGLAMKKNAKYNDGSNIFVDENGKAVDSKIVHGKREYYIPTEKGKATVAQKDLKTSENYQKKEEDVTDICIFIPPAVDMGAQVYTMAAQGKVELQFDQSEPSGRQKQALYAVKAQQEILKKASITQAAGWGTTTACYVTYMSAGWAKPNVGAIARASGAALITSFYSVKAHAHAERAKAIQEIIDAFPNAGECNPHTETTCFCTENSSAFSDPQNYLKYCTPKEFANRFDKDPMVCVDDKGKVDAQCKCAKTNSCIKSFMTSSAAKLGLDGNMLQGPLKGLKSVNSGTGAAGMEGSTNRNLAFAKRGLKKIKPDYKKLPKITLNPKQKKFAKGLVRNGFSPAAAAITASALNADKAFPSSASLASLSPTKKFSQAMAKDSRLKFKSKMARRRSYKRRSGGINRRSTAKKSKSGVVIMDEDYAQKALSKADITRNTTRNLFDIVSSRYQKSGWKRFKDSMGEVKKEEKK